MGSAEFAFGSDDVVLGNDAGFTIGLDVGFGFGLELGFGAGAPVTVVVEESAALGFTMGLELGFGLGFELGLGAGAVPCAPVGWAPIGVPVPPPLL